jgi:hypothetical protein
MLPCFFSTSGNLNPFRTPPYSRFALSAILFCTLRWQALYGRPNGIKIDFFLHFGDNDYGGGGLRLVNVADSLGSLFTFKSEFRFSCNLGSDLALDYRGRKVRSCFPPFLSG